MCALLLNKMCNAKLDSLLSNSEICPKGQVKSLRDEIAFAMKSAF